MIERIARWLSACGLVLFAVCTRGAEPDAVVATVNGRAVRQSDLEAEFFSRRVPPERQAELRARVLDELIDRRLIEAFLDARRAPVPERELQAQLDLLRKIVEATQGDFEQAVAALGFTEATLRRHLSLPLRWKAYVRRTVTDQELRAYFDAHRAEFDGTQVRASQIVLSVPAGADEAAWAQAEATLNEVRREIVSGQISFAEAARQHSTSPSGRDGGDVGYFPFRGRLPHAVASVAFALMPQQLSEVFRSPFGVHLLQVTDRKPGDLSLEDVREAVWEQRAHELWRDQVALERKSARIRIAGAP